MTTEARVAGLHRWRFFATCRTHPITTARLMSESRNSCDLSISSARSVVPDLMTREPPSHGEYAALVVLDHPREVKLAIGVSVFACDERWVHRAACPFLRLALACAWVLLFVRRHLSVGLIVLPGAWGVEALGVG